jgi:hypothetical protein
MLKYLAAAVFTASLAGLTPAQCPPGGCVTGPVMTTPAYTPVASAPQWDWRDGTDGAKKSCLFQNGVQIGGLASDGSYRPLDPVTKTWGPPGKLTSVGANGPVVDYGVDLSKIHTGKPAFEGSTDIPADKDKMRVTVRSTDLKDGSTVKAAITEAGLTDRVLFQQYPPGHWALKPGLDFNMLHVQAGPRESDGKGVMLHSQADVAGVAGALRKADEGFKAEAVPDLRAAGDPWAQVLAFLKSTGPGGFPYWQLLAAGAAVYLYLRNRK